MAEKQFHFSIEFVSEMPQQFNHDKNKYETRSKSKYFSIGPNQTGGASQKLIFEAFF